MNPPAIYTVYFTAWTTGDGLVHFRDDIYGLDNQGTVALAQDPSLIGSPVALAVGYRKEKSLSEVWSYHSFALVCAILFRRYTKRRTILTLP